MKTLQNANGTGNVATETRTASALEADLRAMGYAPGKPAHVTDETLAIDTRIVRAKKCPACRSRGMACKPYRSLLRRGYRILAACTKCPAGEEV